MFHLKDNLFFKKDSNKITIISAPLIKVMDPLKGLIYEPAKVTHEVTVTLEELASVMASMSKRGENSETYREAVDFLTKEP